jgi:GR25 family glycosyltransferase involved in LPS biosynthesis
MNLNYFPKKYCINLEKRADKWDKSVKEFEKFGLEVDRHNAIPHTNGAMGCALSHLKLYKLNLDQPRILVFEDDVQFRGFTSHVDEALRRVPDNWELIYLGGVVFPNEINNNMVFENVFVAKNVVCTHAYGISERGMQFVIRNYPKYMNERSPIDEFFRSVVQPRGHSYVIAPMICEQRAGFSDITKKFGGANDLLLSTNNKFNHEIRSNSRMV